MDHDRISDAQIQVDEARRATRALWRRASDADRASLAAIFRRLTRAGVVLGMYAADTPTDPFAL